MAVSGRKVPKEFSSTVFMGSEEAVQLVCQPCDRDGPRRAAAGYCTDCEEHLCQSCFNSHRSVKPCRNHILLDQNSMPKSQTLFSKSADSSPSSSGLTKPCTRHVKKTLEFYCHDHKTLLCSVCVTLDHPHSTCKVNYIPDISEQIVNSREHNDTISSMATLLNQCQKVKTETKRTTEYSNSSLTNALLEIKKYRQDINRRLDKLEQEVEDATKTLQQKNDKGLETAESTCDDVYKSIKILHDTSIQLNSSKQADKLFLHVKTAQKEIEEKNSFINNLAKVETIPEYLFEPNRSILTCLENENTLGFLEQRRAAQEQHPKRITSLESPDTKQIPLTAISYEKPIYEGDVCVQTLKDIKTCDITGITLLAPGHLVVADMNNNSVKLVDINNKDITSQVILPTFPSDITSVTNKEIAVTMPSEQTIQFMSVTSNKLIEGHSLEVNGCCKGIHCFQQKLVVTYQMPTKLQILDMKGKELATVTTDSSGEDIFNNPSYVTANSRSIYVSNSIMGKSSVIMLNWQGKVTGVCGGLEMSTDLALATDDNLLVCDKDSNTIQEIYGNCTKGTVVLKHLTSPWAVCWCDEKRVLYISTENDNYLKVYKIPQRISKNKFTS